jgi:hypothetical protein
MNIIMQHSHVSYPPSYEIVEDGRILNALVKRGLIDEWDRTHKYINKYNMSRLASDDRIIYNNDLYMIKYFEGCFSPFVCKVINNNEGSK